MTLGLTDHEYKAYPIASIYGLKQLLNGNLIGLNVTSPYKELVIPYLQSISEESKSIGAVNTIKISEEGLQGYNTDIYGFETSLNSLLRSDKKYDALILGTGGAAKAVQFVLEKLEIPFQFVSRSKDVLTYRDLNEEIISKHHLIINTTPIGTAPHYKQYPKIPIDGIGSDHIVYDLIYNPIKTKLLQLASQRNAITKNGLEMLELQADKSWEIWNK